LAIYIYKMNLTEDLGDKVISDDKLIIMPLVCLRKCWKIIEMFGEDKCGLDEDELDRYSDILERYKEAKNKRRIVAYVIEKESGEWMFLKEPKQ
jgi:hypothetical protein